MERAAVDPGALPPLGAILLEAAARAPGAPHLQALPDAGPLRVVTYGQSAAAALDLARRLLDRGLSPGEPVALLGDPVPLQVVSLFGIWLAGGVVAPLDPQWEPEAHGRALAKAGARIAVALPGRAAALAAAAEKSGAARFERIELVEGDLGPPARGPLAAPVAVDPESRALVLFTSGTTGAPKAAVLRHRALAWNARTVLTRVTAGPDDNLLGVLPLHHVFGLLVSALVPALAGARVTFPPSLKGGDLVRTMRETGVSIVAAVPQLVLGIDRAIEARLAQAGAPSRAGVRLLRAATAGARRLGLNPGRALFRRLHAGFGGRLRFVASAGAALDVQAARRLASLGFTVIEGYGLTESGPAIAFDLPAAPRVGTVGPPLPGVEVRLAEPAPDGTGEIVARSPSLFDGYLDDPEETEHVLREGWLWTGDLGRLERDGRLVITGRRKEVIVLGSGKNVYPHEVEARLDESPFVRESCVLGLAEEGRRGSEKLHAVLVPDLEAIREAGASRIEATLRDEVNRIGDRLPSHHRVVGITLRREPLPRTPLGKLRRFQVERELLEARSGARAAGGAAAAVAPPATPQWKAIEGALRQVTGHRGPIGAETGLELDLGLDSLARVEALAALEERLGRKLPDGFGAEAITAGDLLALLERLDAEGGEGAGFQAATSAPARDAELRAPARRLLRPLGLFVGVAFDPVVRLLALPWRFRVRGAERIPEGPCLICPNHASYLDAVAIALALPLRVRLRAWSLGDGQIFSRQPFRFFALFANVIPVEHGAGLKATLEAGGAVLRAGRPLVLFPEGARAPEGQMLPFRRGAAILARTLGVPIVPVWLEGVDRLLPRAAWLPRLGHRLAVRFGAPIDPRQADASPDPAGTLTEILRARVVGLGAEERAARG